jgi:methanethiol S-methyltransferase
MPVMTTPGERDMRLTIIDPVSPAGRVSPGRRLFAWGGALLFAASLGYFLYTYTLTFRESQDGGGTGRAIAWDLALFTVFALHHSVFARTRVRLLIARTVPAPLERSVYVWIAAALFIGVCALWQPVAGVAWSIPAAVAYTVLVLGILLTLKSAAVIDVWDLAGVRQTGSHQPPPAAPEFKTSGPYGYVRHPIYSAWFLMVLGVPVMTGTRLVFALVSCAYLLIAIPLEEGSLRRTTAGAYDGYMRAVPWRLIPRIF